MVDWKSRYAQLLEQSERQQKRYRRKQSLLVDGFISTIQFARGLDQELDTKLLAVQGLLRQDNVKNVDLEQAVAALERASARGLECRQEVVRQTGKTLRKISAQTRSLSVKLETANALKQLERVAKEDEARFKQLVEFIERFQKLHRDAVRESKSSTGGLFNRWFSSPVTVVKAPISDVESEPASVVPEDDSSPESVSIKGTSGGDSSRHAKAPRTDLKHLICDHFVSLLQHLGRPSETAGVEAAIYSNLSASSLPDTIRQVCQLSVDTLDEDRKEFHSSMSRISNRIGDAINQVDRCKSIHEGDDQANQELHSALGERFADIELSLANATDLDGLREAVGASLQRMNQVLLVHQEYIQGSNLSASLETLTQRITHTQDLSRAAQFRLETRVKQSLQDATTGLPNRAALRQRGPLILSQLRQNETTLCIAVCKIALSTHTGDSDVNSLLQGSVRLFNQVLRSADQAYRIGPNQFAVMLSSITLTDTAVLMDQLRQSMASSSGSATMSVGVAECSRSDTIESALARADRAAVEGANQVKLANG